MALERKDIIAFTSGTHNILSDELIPDDAASDSLGWLTKDGKIELMYGRQALGAEGTTGKVWSLHTAYQTDGTAVFYRKIGTKVQYLNGSTWTDVITGLTDTDMTFANFSTVSGNYVFCGSPEDGIFKIVTANPASYADMYDATKNHKGYFFIDKGRSVLWGRPEDKTGVYISQIATIDGSTHTEVSAEAVGSLGSTNYTGTLAFKAGGSTRTCYETIFTDGTQTITFDPAGAVTSSSDGIGTINFMTGAYDITFDVTTTGAVTVNYTWEDSNSGGVTDFTYSATRLAGEGNIFPQDKGGDAIQSVLPYDGSYFSFKENSVYQLTLDADDAGATNELIRTDVGIKTLHSATGTSTGIVYLNTGNPSKPQLEILKRNLTGDDFLTNPLFPHFKFENYNYDTVSVYSWDKFVVVACKEGNLTNDRVLMCDMVGKSVDVAPYDALCFTKDEGLLYSGSPVAETVHEMFSGFDDMGYKVTNHWISKGSLLGTGRLKKVKRYRFKGSIAPDQSIKVYMSLDDGSFDLIGTILGSGEYVDSSASTAIGTTYIGFDAVGGGDTTNTYDFLMEVKVRSSKFRKRTFKFEAQGFGYCAMQQVTDFDIWKYEDKLPKKYRLKQNVSLDGATTDEDSPSY